MTREQLVTFLYRYAKLTGADITAGGSLEAYPDAGRISTYAAEAFAWAVEKKLVNGMGGQLVPKATATRAQVATILLATAKPLAELSRQRDSARWSVTSPQRMPRMRAGKRQNERCIEIASSGIHSGAGNFYAPVRCVTSCQGIPEGMGSCPGSFPPLPSQTSVRIRVPRGGRAPGGEIFRFFQISGKCKRISRRKQGCLAS